jgi:hypothetical protein
MKMFGWFHSPFILRIQLKSECWEMTKLFLRDVDEIAKIRKNAKKDKDRVFLHPRLLVSLQITCSTKSKILANISSKNRLLFHQSEKIFLLIKNFSCDFLCQKNINKHVFFTA